MTRKQNSAKQTNWKELMRERRNFLRPLRSAWRTESVHPDAETAGWVTAGT
jgi:hypothetical protein